MFSMRQYFSWSNHSYYFPIRIIVVLHSFGFAYYIIIMYYWLYSVFYISVRGESTQTADGGYRYREGCSKSQFQHSNPTPSAHRHLHLLQKQKTSSTEVGDSPSGRHVPNCRLVGRVRSLGNNLRLQDSCDFIEYDNSSSRSSAMSQSSSSSYKGPPPPPRSQLRTGNHKYVNTCVMQGAATGRRNLKQFSQLSKVFRSMPDVNGTTYRPPTVCGHKDCRDFYRLKALRSELQQQERKDYLPAPPKRRRTGERQISGSLSSCTQERMGKDARMEVMKQRKDRWVTSNTTPKKGPQINIATRASLSREQEFELSSSELYSAGDDHMSHKRQVLQARDYENTQFPQADAYSVHGLSDAISVESCSSSGSPSEFSKPIDWLFETSQNPMRILKWNVSELYVSDN